MTTIFSSVESNSSKTIIRKILIEALKSPLLHSLTDELFDVLYPNTDKISLLEKILKDEFPSDQLGSFVSVLSNDRKKKKKRWVQSCLKEYNEKKSKRPKELYKEYLSLKELFEMNNDSLLLSSFGHDSLESALANKVELLEKFGDDPSISLIDYPYFKAKTDKQKKSAIELELKFILGTLVINNYNGKFTITDGIEARSISIIKNPSFGLQQDSAVINTDVEPMVIKDKLYVPATVPEEFLTSHTGLELFYSANADAIIKNNKRFFLFDEKDDQLFSEVVSKRNKINPRSQYFVDVGELAYKIFKDTSLKHYKAVEKRLHNMAFVRYHKNDENSSITFGLLDQVRIEKGGTKWIASIMLNSVICEDIIANRTIAMYSDVISSFESKVTNILIYALQYERVELYSSENRYMKNFYDYIFFAHKIRFNSRKKKENFNLIIEALNEMKEKQVVISDYKLISDFKVEITYLPFSDYELHDLIKTETPFISLNNTSPSSI